MEGASPAAFCCSPLKCWINKLQVTDAIHFCCLYSDSISLIIDLVSIDHDLSEPTENIRCATGFRWLKVITDYNSVNSSI